MDSIALCSPMVYMQKCYSENLTQQIKDGTLLPWQNIVVAASLGGDCRMLGTRISFILKIDRVWVNPEKKTHFATIDWPDVLPVGQTVVAASCCWGGFLQQGCWSNCKALAAVTAVKSGSRKCYSGRWTKIFATFFQFLFVNYLKRKYLLLYLLKRFIALLSFISEIQITYMNFTGNNKQKILILMPMQDDENTDGGIIFLKELHCMGICLNIKRLDWNTLISHWEPLFIPSAEATVK